MVGRKTLQNSAPAIMALDGHIPANSLIAQADALKTIKTIKN
jgi:hypothetical protein